MSFAYKLFSFMLFACCASYVIMRSYNCFCKYLDGTVAVDITYQSSGEVDFPSITFCGRISSMFRANDQPKPFNIQELAKCNLTWQQYYDGQWTSENLPDYCHDPKKVAEKVLAKLEDLNFNSLKFVTFNAETIYKSLDEESGLIWEQVYLRSNGRCFTMTIPQEIIELGIYQVVITYKPQSILDVFVHHHGLLDTDLPGASPKLDLEAKSVTVPVEHEKLQMLDYAGEKCMTETKYKLDDCRNEYIHNQSLSMFGCTTPFGLVMEHICKDVNQSKKALEFYYNVYNDRFNIPTCPYPCSSLKVKFMNKADSGSSSLLLLPKGTLQFDKFVKVTKSYMAYTELELIAECGGYVGLFLGISVFHLREAFNMILQFTQHQN